MHSEQHTSSIYERQCRRRNSLNSNHVQPDRICLFKIWDKGRGKLNIPGKPLNYDALDVNIDHNCGLKGSDDYSSSKCNNWMNKWMNDHSSIISIVKLTSKCPVSIVGNILIYFNRRYNFVIWKLGWNNVHLIFKNVF